MNDYLFYGAMTEPIAPMDKEGNIDYELLKAQVQFQLDHKIHAIFVSGLTECMVTSVDAVSYTHLTLPTTSRV